MTHASDLAHACAKAMVDTDIAGRHMEFQLVSAEPGRAVMTMTVLDWMVNSHGTCHGGILFTFADSAFGVACNSHNERAMGQHCSMTYVAPAERGDRLVARAVERSRSGRSGIYDVTVTREEGVVIAEFRGHSRTLGTPLLEDRR